MIKILIPAYNEENSIGNVVEEFSQLGQVVVCDNNSDDNTAEEAERAGAKVVFEKKVGKGNAIRKLLEEESDVYLITDADGAFKAEDGKKLLNLIANGADLVIGKRENLNEHNKNLILTRDISKKALNYYFNKRYPSNVKINDFMSGLRAFNNKIKFFELKSNGWDIETEMTLKAIKNNLKVIEIPVKVRPRHSGKQKSNIFNVGFPVLKRILFS